MRSPNAAAAEQAEACAPARPSWANPTFALSTMAQVHSHLGDSSLLDSFFTRLDEIVTLLEVAPGTNSCNTTLARDMIRLKRLNVLLYGRSGAGKTTLIGTVTNQAEAVHEDGEQAVTLQVSNYHTASGITFTDRPGIDIPGAQAENAEAASSIAPTGTGECPSPRGNWHLRGQPNCVRAERSNRLGAPS